MIENSTIPCEVSLILLVRLPFLINEINVSKTEKV